MLTTLPHRSLGNTGIKVSIAGLGTVKFGRNNAVKYPVAFDLPSDGKLRQLLASARDLGINLLDTAPAYGNSEQRLGKLIRHERDQWIICSKAGEFFDPHTGHSRYDFSVNALVQSVESSLRRLKTDYLDLLLIHSNGDDLNIINQWGALDTLAELRKKGLVRAIGMSSKTVTGSMLALEKGDCVMITLNQDDQSEVPTIQQAQRLNKGILVKKVFASGHHTQSNQIQATFDMVYSHPGVTSTILGTINPQHLAGNVDAIIKAVQS